MFKKFKDKALENAMKAMGNDKVQEVMSSPEFQSFMLRAFQTSMKVKNDVGEARKTIAKRMNVVTGDDLEDLKRNLDRLDRKVRDLKDENETLKEKLEDADAVPES